MKDSPITNSEDCPICTNRFGMLRGTTLNCSAMVEWASKGISAADIESYVKLELNGEWPWHAGLRDAIDAGQLDASSPNY